MFSFRFLVGGCSLDAFSSSWSKRRFLAAALVDLAGSDILAGFVGFFGGFFNGLVGMVGLVFGLGVVVLEVASVRSLKKSFAEVFF